MKRTYVDVGCDILANGTIIPLKVMWKDGRNWDVKRVIHVSTSMSGDFEGTRYRVLIGKRERDLYYSRGRWFVEDRRKEAVP